MRWPAVLLVILAAGCKHSPTLPPDTLPQVSLAGTTTVDMPANPSMKGMAYSFQAPAGMRQSDRFETQIKYGQDVVILCHVFPNADRSFNESRDATLKALLGQTKAPAGYVVAAPLFGTVEERKQSGATQWSVQYDLFDGERFLSVHASYRPGDPEAERKAREGAAYLIRTIKIKG